MNTASASNCCFFHTSYFHQQASKASQHTQVINCASIIINLTEVKRTLHNKSMKKYKHLETYLLDEVFHFHQPSKAAIIYPKRITCICCHTSLILLVFILNCPWMICQLRFPLISFFFLIVPLEELTQLTEYVTDQLRVKQTIYCKQNTDTITTKPPCTFLQANNTYALPEDRKG
jgi:hypothetical protein